MRIEVSTYVGHAISSNNGLISQKLAVIEIRNIFIHCMWPWVLPIHV